MEKILAKSYARLIIAGRKTIDEVPEKIKPYIDDAIKAIKGE